MTCVYQLDVVYPEGSHEKDWRPELWSNPKFLATLTRKERRELAKREFRWPRVHLYLSSSGAYQRAWLLRSFGAEVEVLASRPVEWPNYDDPDSLEPHAWEWAPTAVRWSYAVEKHGGAQLEDDDIERFREQSLFWEIVQAASLLDQSQDMR